MSLGIKERTVEKMFWLLFFKKLHLLPIRNLKNWEIGQKYSILP